MLLKKAVCSGFNGVLTVLVVKGNGNVILKITWALLKELGGGGGGGGGVDRRRNFAVSGHILLQ